MKTEKVWVQEILEVRFNLYRIFSNAFYSTTDLFLVLTQEFLKFIHRVRHISFTSAHKEHL